MTTATINEEGPRVYTVREVAALLKFSERTIHRMIQSGEIHTLHIRGDIRILASEVDRILSQPERREGA